MPAALPKEVKLLSDIASALASTQELNQTLERILCLLDTHLGLQRGSVYLLNKETEQLELMVAHGVAEESKKNAVYQIGEGLTGTVFKSGESIIVPDVTKDPRFLGKAGTPVAGKGKMIAFFCLPIKLEGKTIGTISVSRESKSDSTFLTNASLLNVIATMVGQAVKLAQKLEKERTGWQEENRKLREQLRNRFDVHNMVGSSNAMQGVYQLIEQVAESNATVMIRGESGTGKDLVAHAIHYKSLRAEKPFVKINCTALPESLLESELFGHEKGAFTGAIERKKGRFEMAKGGTIFLDEIGDFTPGLQVKLLRVIQFREFERVGGSETIEANVRIVVATHKHLEKLIETGEFREDLYYRINVFPIFLPPLRERKDDIMLLADYFLEKFSKENRKRITRLSTPAIEMLTSYHWPGNIRELENCIERAVLMCNEDVIRSEHLPPSLQMVRRRSAPGRTLPEMVENLERELIVDSLKKTGGHQRKAAAELGLTERMLGYKVKKYGIYPKQLV
ncbi:Nif-specific regulatory protein [Limihaloglobus sulfuriphilus]|uniref:Nif-specific regulatory protein n=1 Tax=Limihaloglobus sulfuriphilus TaxID=1851148 RepID=A0A1Q2MI32_9BACT|nr:sigma 54-interacting transcriptional regulator [Limihaloglobus sulfuriphilus]AQQ72365.1 Nif-specific regulatory protein [Limihaloglobus sulfuriphilus]